MFKVGDEVSYGLHGKCVITAIETKELPSGATSFYQVRMLKNPIIAKTPIKLNKMEPYILIPVDNAEAKGLRPLMTKEKSEEALKFLADGDYHFEMNQTWGARQKTLEEVIRKEGAIGLAKVVGHLYTLIRRDAVPPTDVLKFYESVYRIFAREIADSMGLTSKEVDPLIARALKAKLSRDH